MRAGETWHPLAGSPELADGCPGGEMQAEWVAEITPPGGRTCAAASGKGGLDAQLRDAVRENRQPGCNRRYPGSPRRPASGRPGEPA